MGVRGRLLLAFLGISMFSLVAAASGLYSLSQVGGALKKITEQRVPEALSWLELSRRVERVVRAAPALLVVNTFSARLEVWNEIASQIAQVEPFLQRSRSYETEDEKTATAEVVDFFADMTKNLVSLDELVEKRLSIAALKEKRIRNLSKANSIAKRMLSPGERSGNGRSKPIVKRKVGSCEFDNKLDSTTKGRAPG
jgi:phosphoglycerate-specific signal transduction histidine kinase